VRQENSEVGVWTTENQLYGHENRVSQLKTGFYVKNIGFFGNLSEKLTKTSIKAHNLYRKFRKIQVFSVKFYFLTPPTFFKPNGVIGNPLSLPDVHL